MHRVAITPRAFSGRSMANGSTTYRHLSMLAPNNRLVNARGLLPSHYTIPTPHLCCAKRYRSQYAAEEEQEMSEMMVASQKDKLKQMAENSSQRKQEKREQLVKGETTFHPLRTILSEELHARSPLSVPPPFKASHLVYLTREDPDAFDECLAHISALCHQYNLSPPYAPSVDEVIDSQLRARHYAADFGPFYLKWERHTEFTTYTFVRRSDAPSEKLFEDPVIKWVPYSWRRNIPGSLLCAVNVTLEAGPPSLSYGNINTDQYTGSESHMRRLSSQYFGGKRVIGGLVAKGTAEAFSDFHIHPDGFQRLLVRDLNTGLSAEAANKLVQSLLDIESYRMMALLGLPIARKMSPQIHTLNESLYHVTSNLNNAREIEDKRRILYRMFGLSSDVDKLISTGLYRFDASAAYYQIVKKRLDAINEVESATGHKQFASFYERRMGPAMATCEHVVRRMDKLRHALHGPAELLQASINLEQEAQTQKMLESLDRRSHISLRLQETVEGLSVCAISYYSLGLLSYAFDAASAAGLLGEISTNVAVGASAPFIVLMVWGFMRRARKSIMSPTESSKTGVVHNNSNYGKTYSSNNMHNNNNEVYPVDASFPSFHDSRGSTSSRSKGGLGGHEGGLI